MTLSEIKKAIQGLSYSEREELFSSFEVSVESFINLEETRFSNGIYCPHCGTLEIANFSWLKPFPFRSFLRRSPNFFVIIS